MNFTASQIDALRVAAMGDIEGLKSMPGSVGYLAKHGYLARRRILGGGSTYTLTPAGNAAFVETFRTFPLPEFEVDR